MGKFIVGWALNLVAMVAMAQPFQETEDAGETLASAAVLPAGVTLIQGVAGYGEIDLYRLRLEADGPFTAYTVAPGGDTQLFLFDADGYGIIADEDSGDGYNASLQLDYLPAGEYYLGISGYNYDPLSTEGPIFSDGCCGALSPVGPGGQRPLVNWSGWTYPSETPAGRYSIFLWWPEADSETSALTSRNP
ncbi:MAG: DVUA0089 family protein [Pseudomonadota bacterium]|nr:DVUA0089 family protein [Pseudomonadota bacterium]